MARVVLVACVAAKGSTRAPARDLYTSPWFRKARTHAEARGDRWFVLSAKHGLVEPERRLAPYEHTLNDLGVVERRAWAHRVLEQLLPQLEPGDEVQFLAGERYREHLIPILDAAGIRTSVPMRGLGIGEQLAWLSGSGDRRPAAVRRLYEILEEHRARLGGFQRLGQGAGSIPREARGVYFFFDEAEARSTSGAGPRVVRVGTLGVSRGSKATLWARLRQHRGTRDGRGSHRGSVFRLLVGAALIRREGITCPTWASGSSATPAVRAKEEPLERRVSAYLGELPYLWVQIDDEAGPDSRRAYVERNAIALLSNWDRPPVDPPTSNWLGRESKDEVAHSGLWNSNHVTEAWDPEFLTTLAELCSG